jgi:hypothetical protein
MRLRTLLLAATATVVVGLAIFAVGLATAVESGRDEGRIVHRGTRAVRGPVRVRCDRPRKLRLVRFEDGSAQLRCGREILARVSVPG